MLDYTARLTSRPASVDKQHVNELRQHGFDDRAIHDLCAIVAYFAFANRIASGLGIEIESDDSADQAPRGEID